MALSLPITRFLAMAAMRMIFIGMTLSSSKRHFR
jgi:hypothetical protein